MVEVPDEGTYIVVDGKVMEARTIELSLEHVGMGAAAYVLRNGVDHVLFAVEMNSDCPMCQAYTSKARVDSGDLTAEALCPQHQPAAIDA